MFYKTWNVLLVDDEPDVLSLSKLVMKNFAVHGVPIKVNTAQSKADALAFIKSQPGAQWWLSVAIIDVVMETDTAGLELCQYIREEMGNQITQLFIRTGQPGIAPERSVIDRYDINGYFTKEEATEDKLYSMIKTGVRQFYWTTLSLGAMAFQEAFIADAAGSREKLETDFRHLMENLVAVGGLDFKRCNAVNDKVIDIKGWDESTARELMVRLDEEPGTTLSPEGDKFVAKDGLLLLKAVDQPSRVESWQLLETAFVPPVAAATMAMNVYKGLGTAWRGAT